jgi:putative flippase GtrA
MKRELIMFIIVGLINTFNYYVLYLLLNWVSNNYMFSHIVAFLISMVGSFYLNTYLTYRTKPTLKKFLQFPLTYVVNISVSTLSIFILVDFMKMNDKIAPLAAVLVAIPFTFVISRKILKQN